MRQSLRTLAYPLCVDAGVANDGGSGSNVWLLGYADWARSLCQNPVLVDLTKTRFEGN